MKRLLPIAVALLVALLGFGSAGVVNQVGVRWALALPEGGEIEPLPDAPEGEGEGGPQVADASKDEAKGAKTVVRKPRSHYVSGILARNIFDSSAIGKDDGPVEEGDAVSDLKVDLLATIVAVPSRSSSALVMVDQEKYPRVVGIGGLLGTAEVTAIESQRIELRRADGKVEYIKLKTGDDKEKPATGGATTTTAVGDDGIVQHSETSFSLPRETVNKYIADIDGIAKLGRAIPHRGPDGNVDGFRLSGVRRGTIGEQLGIRNGDVVHGVNGKSLTSMGEAMQAFGELQSAGKFTFEITRRGKKQTMEYTVR